MYEYYPTENSSTLDASKLFMKQTINALKSRPTRVFDEKYVLSFSIIATVVNFLYAPFSFFVLHNSNGALINGSSSILLAFTIIIRKGKLIDRTLAENLLLGIAYLTMFSLSYRSGGLTSAIIPWYIVVNMFSLTVNNKKVAIFWTSMAVISMTYFWAAKTFFHFDFPNDYLGEYYETWFFAVLIGVFILGIKIVGVIEDRNNEFIATLTEKNIELQNRQEEIIRLQKYKENFLANITHELRTPLSAIKGISELLKMEISEIEKNEMIDGLNKSSKHLLHMINDILDFSKLKEGKLILRQQPFNIEDTIQTACRLLKINANDKGLAFVLEVKKLPNTVIGDENRIIQMLVNVIGNSIKFTNSGSIKVICTAEFLDEKMVNICLKISDTGVGISKENVKLIFDDYVQADENVAAQFGGTGLGLGITKRLVELYNGTISCESEINIGTCFTINLPLEYSNNNNQIHENLIVDFSVIEQNELKILIADDNKMNLMVAEMLIKKSLPKAIIYKVENGYDAVQFVSKNTIDLVLMDMKMPVMDGITATQEIRLNKNFDVKIIAITSATSDAEINQCLSAGMDDYIAKPFNKNELLSKIQQAYLLSKMNKTTLLN
jgi:two-component system, sensor histidine kinase